MIKIKDYNRTHVIEYAHTWAFSHNPKYDNFSDLGGDCTNFASQSIFSGSNIMNYTPITGWYYKSMNQRTASWTATEYLYKFLTTNEGIGPFGHEVSINEVMPGDIVQLSFNGHTYTHSPVIVAVDDNPSVDNILVATHTINADNRPISTYAYKKLRYIHIDGVGYN